jgi:hypothetical protein
MHKKFNETIRLALGGELSDDDNRSNGAEWL